MLPKEITVKVLENALMGDMEANELIRRYGKANAFAQNDFDFVFNYIANPLLPPVEPQDQVLNIKGVLYQYAKQPDYQKAKQLFEESTQLQNQTARNNLALMHQKGWGCEKNIVLAQALFSENINLGNIIAHYRLARLLLELGGEEQLREARTLLVKSADLGHEASMNALALMLSEGRGGKRNNAEAVRWFQQSADRGNSKGMFFLGRMLEKGVGCDQDEQKALYWFNKSADLRNSHAMLRLARMILEGRGCEENREKGLAWLELSAELNNSKAMFYLAKLLSNNDKEKALEWFRKSAELNNSNAMLALGLMYQEGIGTAQDSEAAKVWLLKSTALNNSEAMYYLGDILLEGESSEQDKAEGKAWLTKSAQLNNSQGQCALGALILEEEDLEQDLAAMNLFIKSAELNNNEAMYFLGNIYLNGRACQRDDQQAKLWFQKSADHGNEKAALKLRELELSDNKESNPLKPAEMAPSYSGNFLLNALVIFSAINIVALIIGMLILLMPILTPVTIGIGLSSTAITACHLVGGSTVAITALGLSGGIISNIITQSFFYSKKNELSPAEDNPQNKPSNSPYFAGAGEDISQPKV